MLKVKTEGPKRNLYWRATTLDDYTGTGWQESLDLATESDSNQIDSDSLALLPAAARNQANWVKQEVTVEALKDNHLIASAQPMRWDPPSDATFQDQGGDIVVLSRSLQRDQTYTVWSYAPRPTPKELGQSRDELPGVDRALPGGHPDGRGAEVRHARPRPPDECLLRRALRRRSTHAAEPRALRRRQEGRRGHDESVRGCNYARGLVPPAVARRVRLRRAAAGGRAEPAGARPVRHADEARLLPALRRRDGAHAPLPRHSGSRGGRVHERELRRRFARVDRDGSRGA